jgi:hypothetical protein
VGQVAGLQVGTLPVPTREALAEPPGEALKDSVADLGPADIGLNLAVTWQDMVAPKGPVHPLLTIMNSGAFGPVRVTIGTPVVVAVEFVTVKEVLPLLVPAVMVPKSLKLRFIEMPPSVGTAVQTPAWQVVPTRHTTPHAPQLLPLAAVLTHRPLHAVWPATQVKPPSPGNWQALAKHEAPPLQVEQAAPALPQAESVRPTRHTEPAQQPWQLPGPQPAVPASPPTHQPD